MVYIPRWDNIKTTVNAEGISSIYDSVGRRSDSIFSGLENILKSKQQIDTANNLSLVNNATNDFLNKLQGMSPEQLQTAKQSGAIDQMRNSYGLMLNEDKAGAAAIQNLLKDKYQQVNAANQFKDSEARRAALPLVNQITEYLNNNQTGKANELIRQLPADMQAELMARSDKISDSLASTRLSNTFADAHAGNDVAGMRSAIIGLKNAGLDASGQIGQLKQYERNASLNDLTSRVMNLGDTINQSYSQDRQALNALAAKELGLPIVNNSVDLSNASLDQIEKFKKLESSFGSQVSGERLFKEQIAPLLKQHSATFGDDYGNLQRTLTSAMNEAANSSGLNPFDQQELNRQISSMDQAMQQSGNIYYQGAYDIKGADDTLGINTMYRNAIKDNPVYAEFDAKDHQKITGQLASMLKGVKIGTEHIPVPPAILELALQGANGNTFTGNTFENQVKQMMIDSGAGEHWKVKQENEAEKVRLTNSFKEAAGQPNKDYRSSLRLKADQQEAKLKQAVKDKIEADKKAKEAEEEQKFREESEKDIIKNLFSENKEDNRKGYTGAANKIKDVVKDYAEPVLNLGQYVSNPVSSNASMMGSLLKKGVNALVFDDEKEAVRRKELDLKRQMREAAERKKDGEKWRITGSASYWPQ